MMNEDSVYIYLAMLYKVMHDKSEEEGWVLSHTFTEGLLVEAYNVLSQDPSTENKVPCFICSLID